MCKQDCPVTNQNMPKVARDLKNLESFWACFLALGIRNWTPRMAAYAKQSLLREIRLRNE